MPPQVIAVWERLDLAASLTERPCWVCPDIVVSVLEICDVIVEQNHSITEP